jgi:hypothetical protein
MGSQLKSEYPPIMLQVQIGNVICQARFIVTNHLKSSKILLGSDFLVKNHMSIGAINPEDHSWICTIGTPIIGKVKGKVVNKISLTFGENVYMAPNEVKRIEVQDVPENLVLSLHGMVIRQLLLLHKRKIWLKFKTIHFYQLLFFPICQSWKPRLGAIK